MLNCMDDINARILSDPAAFVADTEKAYRQRIEALAERIAANREIQIILLAGPSASGKTTSACILIDDLKDLGIHAERVSLDDFYKTHDKMPLDENGELDYESIDSLETDDIARCINELLSKRKTELPIFNFTKKAREANTRTIDIGPHGVVIFEGLHALNPVILNQLPEDHLLKLYISVGEDYRTNAGKLLLGSRNIRLMRRLSRDKIYRNSPLEKSLHLWTNVVKGENRFLIPYKPTADEKLQSFHEYELCVFKELLEKDLKKLPESVPNYDRVAFILNAMEKAAPLSPDFVPEDSLLKEFMKGGKYE